MAAALALAVARYKAADVEYLQLNNKAHTAVLAGWGPRKVEQYETGAASAAAWRDEQLERCGQLREDMATLAQAITLRKAEALCAPAPQP